MSARVDIANQRFGRLTVVKISGKDGGGRLTWLCRCDCGGEAIVSGHHLRARGTGSCGCVRVETLRARSLRHGLSKTRAHQAWANMIQRCTNPQRADFNRYGGRGISVCGRWRDFALFFSDMGESPAGLSLDRIDNDGNYEPSNCRWATDSEQNNNTRKNRRVIYSGRLMTARQLSDLAGIPYDCMRRRLFVYGWTADSAVSTRLWQRRDGEFA